MLFGYIIYLVVYAIWDDIYKKELVEIERITKEIALCKDDYIKNECEPSIRIPALQNYCARLEKCMARDPALEVFKTAIFAELVGNTLNAFTKPLEWKSIAFIFLFVVT